MLFRSEQNLIKNEEISILDNQIKSELEEARTFAESGKSESIETLLKHEFYGA